MSPRSLSFAAVLLTAILPAWVADATAADTKASIQKCQDATGKWHYGDRAAQECGKSKIEVMSEQGLKKKEIAAPPTEAELVERERRKGETEREERTAAEQARRDQILLQSYPREDDLVLYRDRKLSQLDSSLKSSEETLKSLRKVLERLQTQKQAEEEKNDKKALAQTEKNIEQTKVQIANHEAVIAQTRHDQEKVRRQFDEDIARYRELKLQQQTKSPTKKTATP